MNNYEMIYYENNGISVDVRFDDENKTIWLTQSEIAIVFNTSKNNIIMLIKSILKNCIGGKCDLPPESIEIVVNNQKTKAFNLEMIEAISQRSKSTSGYDFVKWAKEYIKNKTNYSYTQKSPNEATNYDIVVFEDGDFKLAVTVSPLEETVWLTQEDIAKLFETTIPNISMHIKNIYESNEQDKWATLKKSLIVQDEGGREVTREKTYYNFDMVLSVGFKVNSPRGVLFRKWATKILKDYSFNGYSINERKLNNLDKGQYELTKKVFKIDNRMDNAYYILASVIKKLDNVTNDVDILKGEKEVLKGMILYENDFYTGYSFTKRLMLSAKEKIILVDGYMDLSVLDMLNEVDSNLPITIYTYPSARLTNKEIAKFSETHNLTYIRRTILHGRFLAIDDELYLFDGSIKDIGKNRTVVVKIDFTTIDKIIEE